MLVCVDLIAHRQRTAIKHTFQRIIGHTAYNLFGKVNGIVFSEALKHGFKDNTLCAIGNNLGSGNNLNAVLLQLRLVSCAVIAISGKPVKFPNDNHIKQFFAAVLDHALKFWAVVGLCGNCPVDVVTQNGNSILISKRGTFAELTSYGFLALIIRRISRVNYCRHAFTVPNICIKVCFNCSFMGESGSKHISTNFANSGLSATGGFTWYSLPCGSSQRQVM